MLHVAHSAQVCVHQAIGPPAHSAFPSAHPAHARLPWAGAADSAACSAARACRPLDAPSYSYAAALHTPALHRNERSILGATVLRVLFVPAFHFAAVGGAGPAVIGLLTLLLGLSNGYLTGCAMMEAPALVPPAAAELAGNLMVLALIAGLCIGAGCGFLWLL